MNRFMTGRQPLRHQEGASLIEVLVAVLILTVGLLSMIALHAASMRYGKMAEFKTTATQLAEDLADRMRSNLAGVYSGDYVATLESNDNLTQQSVPEIPNCTATDGTCETILGKAVAKRDLAEWINQAYPNLPGLGLVMQRPGGANSSVMDVWIGWLEPTGRTADAAGDALINDAYACPASMKASAQLRCMRFSFTL
ncbi:MAG: type IV pilus modification protein PilV [Rubrivivax sp.]|nr:MAG: type IV pilus modification protein PilV [Rubrivivax sp.]